MEYDNYVIIDNDIEKTIYPMAEINIENEKFVIYVNEIKETYSSDDFCIGQEANNKILPVKENLLTKFEKVFDELIKKIIESKRDN